MKKITLIAALLGSVYFANAQVGINTTTPATSAELEIVHDTKGILIPRVELTDITIFAPIVGAEVESLLVFNKNGSKEAPKGFYYWENGKWNLVVNQAHLDEVIKNIGGDITNVINDINDIKKVINFILPSNPGNEDDKKEDHTTIVYEGGKFYEVSFNETTEKYETTLIDITKVIAGFETNTFFKEIIKDGKVTGYVYFNEQSIVDFLKANPTLTEKDIKADSPGGIVIDVVGTVVNNIVEILNTEIQVDGSTTTIIDLIKNQDGNVIYTTVAGDKVFQYYDATTKEYVTINIEDIIKGNETVTSIGAGKVTIPAAQPTFVAKTELDAKIDLALGTVLYEYKNEGTAMEYLNLTQDMLYSIEHNAELNDFIKNIVKEVISTTGGNVYYGDHDDDKTTSFEFYQIVNNKKELIDIFQIVKNVFTKYKDEIKNLLGDHITNNTYVKTGDTIDGRDVFVTKGVTAIAANSAATSGVEVDGSAIETVISIKLLKGLNLVTTSVTDVKIDGSTIKFNIGTGNMYQVLPEGSYDVIIEFLAKKTDDDTQTQP